MPYKILITSLFLILLLIAYNLNSNKKIYHFVTCMPGNNRVSSIVADFTSNSNNTNFTVVKNNRKITLSPGVPCIAIELSTLEAFKGQDL